MAITLVAEVVEDEMVSSFMGFLFTLAWDAMVVGPSLFGGIVDWKGYAVTWSMVAIFAELYFYAMFLSWIKKNATS